MIRKKKKFEFPRKLYDKPRILEENKLLVRYGLKNKKEIWKAEAKIKYFRTRAKSLIAAEQNEQQKFFVKLNNMGLKVRGVSDVLALNKEDLLKRRLPSILVDKKMANAPKQARQMVVHKRILVGTHTVNVPSYLVGVKEENSISIKKKIKKPKIPEEKKVEKSGEEENAAVNGEIKPEMRVGVVVNA
jgi:small subunit ribosomal protein S4